MKRILFLICTLLCTNILLSQNSLSVKGVVIDGLTEESIPFCNVVLLDIQDSTKLLAGNTTNSEGEFSIKLNKELFSQIKDSLFYFKVSFIGYQELVFPITREKFLNTNKEEIELGDIKMYPSLEELEVYEIVEKKQRYEVDSDKIIMNVDEATSAIAVTAFDLLKNVPGVIIDKDENISLNGQSGVLIQINERDMRIGWEAIKSMLKSLTPQQVEKIEVISNPSAKYDAEGTAGVINIKIKKNKNYGFNGSVNGGLYYSNEPSYNSGVNLNFANEKLTSSLNISTSTWQQYVASSSVRDRFSGSDTIRFQMPEFGYIYKQQGCDINFSTDYLLNERNSIGIFASYNLNRNPLTTYFTTENLSFSPALEEIIQSITFQQSTFTVRNNYNFEMTYLHKFDTIGTKLQLELNTHLYDSDNKVNTTTDYFHNPSSTILKQDTINNLTEEGLRTITAKIDFIKPTIKYGTFEAGAKLMLTNMNNLFFKTENSLLTENDFLFKEDIFATYLSYSNKLGNKTSFRTGLRMEHTIISGISNDYSNSNKYTDLFPSLSLTHSFNQLNILTLSYNYRLQRPSHIQLNPFIIKTSDFIYKSGNPLLNPQYAHIVSINYSLFYMAFLNVSYGYGTDFISEEVVPWEEFGSILERPSNMATSQNLAAGLTIVAPIAKWLDMNLYSQINYTNVEANKNKEYFYIENTQYMFTASANFNLPKKIKLSLSGYYMSGGIWSIYRYDGSHAVNLGISKAFLKDDRLKLSFNINNMFAKKEIGSEFTHNGIHQIAINKIPGAMYMFNLRYNFGRMYQNKIIDKIKTDDMNERAKGGKGN